MIILQAAAAGKEGSSGSRAQGRAQAALEQVPKWVTDNATTTTTTTAGCKHVEGSGGRNNELLLHLLRYST